jgi:hypothetical protein
MVEADSHLKLLPTYIIFIRHIHSIWAHWYVVHRQTVVAAFHSYTHPTQLRFWGSGSLVESKWCHYVMVEAGSNLKLLPASILDIYKVFEYNAMLSINIQQQPSLTLTQFTHSLIGSDFGVRGHLWSQNDVIMSWMRLTATSNCFPHVY